MFKKLSLVLVVAIVAIILIMPAIALNDYEVGETDRITVHIEAKCDYYRDWDSEFSIVIAQVNYEKPSYWSFFADYWMGNTDTQSIVPPSTYPFLQVLIQKNNDVSTRVVDYTPYTYASTIMWDGEYEVEIGDAVLVQAQIYWAQSSGVYESEEYVVI